MTTSKTTTKRTLTMTAAASLLAAMALTGCGRHDENGTPVATRPATQAPAGELHADASQAIHKAGNSMDRAGDRMAQAGHDTAQGAKSAAESVGNKVDDAAITTSVNAKLAKDPNLSAMKIDVDTSGGNVALHGTAPDSASKQRATELAKDVDGVKSVENQLTVKK